MNEGQMIVDRIYDDHRSFTDSTVAPRYGARSLDPKQGSPDVFG
jgi:hypothetical protein